MAGLDVINTVLYELREPLQLAFEQNNPVMEYLEKRGNISTQKARYIEGSSMGGSSAKMKGIKTGAEILDGTRTEETHNWRISPHRGVTALTIPKIEAIFSSGKAAIAKLMEKYPVAHIAGLANDFDRFFLTGVSNGVAINTAEMQGWNTFNGQKTWTYGVTGVANGAFRFEAPASQTTAFQDLARSSAYFWNNQWGESTSSATVDEVVRKQHRLASRTKGGRGPDVIWCDDDTFAIFEKANKGQIKLVTINDKVDKGGKSSESVIPIYNADLMAAQNLILTDFTAGTAAASGVCYGLTTEDIEMVKYVEPVITDFVDGGQFSDQYAAKYEIMFALVFNRMCTQFAITGSARA